ncbi:tRNA dimethylallyltransferase [Gammaproteobacteria bacterium]
MPTLLHIPDATVVLPSDSVPDHLPLAIFLMGPTASGKTELAVELVRRLPCTIISVDSTMVYRGMDIGSAKPGPEVLAIAPHRLIDIHDPAEAYSAAQFRSDALREMEDITAAGRVPLLVGGTMLYFRALERGLAPLPEADPEVRARLATEAVHLGWAALHARLATLDPVLAQRIHPNDPQRIQRALEIIELTGRPPTELFASEAPQKLPYRLIKLVISPADRPLLQRRIAARFVRMLGEGLVGEVEVLYNRKDLGLHTPALRAVGYRQVWEHLAGSVDFATMQERAVVATRQLARRQLTWLRPEPATQWLESTDPGIVGQALRVLAQNGFPGY